jgi:Cupin-like domain
MPEALTIARIPALPADEFERRYVRTSTPVILTGMMADWPARRLWSFDYFAEKFGRCVVTAGKTRGGVLELSDETGIPQIEIEFGRYVQMVREGRADCYVLSPVHEQIPALLDDVVPPAPYLNARWHSTRLWVSADETCSPLHRDWPENLYGQVFGRKRFLLIPRRETARVYTRPFYSGVPNFSRVDAEHPDYDRFPRFRDVPQTVIEVNAGEFLYIPRMWWHQVRSLEPSASINFWFGNGAVALAAMASQMYAKLRGLRK